VERRAAVTRLVATLLAGLLLCAPVGAQDRVVLVAAADSPIEALSSFEVRKLYLGISVFKNDRLVRAIRNASDPRLEDIFLQSIVGQSEQRYERRLLTNVFKFGTARPEEFSESSALIEALVTNPYAVSYILVGDEIPNGLKELRVLWQEL
jgi:hypothetical protein